MKAQPRAFQRTGAAERWLNAHAAAHARFAQNAREELPMRMRTAALHLFALAALLSRRCRARRNLSEQAHPHRRAAAARLERRPDAAHPRPASCDQTRPARRDREPLRRGAEPRRRIRLPRRAGRLHPPRHAAGAARHQPELLSEPAVRSVAVRADHHHGEAALHPGGASQGAGRDVRGVHRLRQGQPGQAQLRHAGTRLELASDRRDAQARSRHPDDARALCGACAGASPICSPATPT